MPISAAHLAYATSAFSALTLQGVDKLGVRLTPRQRQGYIHIWRYVGWLMGVPEEILLNSEAEGLEFARIGRICEPPPDVDSIIMAHTMVSSGAAALGTVHTEKERRRITKYGYRMCRAFIGHELADQLDFPKYHTFGVLAGLRT